MSVLSKIRENVGLVIVIIAISLGVFILTDLLRGIGGAGSNDSSVGKVAGEKVDYNEYIAKVEEFQRNVNQQLSADQEQELRNAAWNQVVNEVLLTNEYNSLGITISDDEISQMFLGPWVSPAIRQSEAFMDANGNFSADTVRKRLQIAESIEMNNPETPDQARQYKMFMINIRNQVIQNRLQEKYSSLLYGSVYATSNEVKRRNADENTKLNISYVAIPYSSISDDQVTVTDADYRAVYDKRKNQYKRNEMEVTISYAIFPIVPSRADSSGKKSELSRMIPDFMAQDSASLLGYAVSSTDAAGIDTTYRPLNQLPDAVSKGIAAFGTDTVIGPSLDREAGSYAIYRISGQRQSEKPVVKARHILVNYAGSTAQDTANARSRANAIRNMVNNGNFAQVAQDSSKDFMTQGLGGDLGWISEGQFGPGSDDFDKKLMEQGVGSIYTAQSARGYHVVEIMDKSSNLYQVTTITRRINPGFTTTDSVNQVAFQFAAKASAFGSLDSAAKEFPATPVLTSQPLTPGSSTLAGVKGARPMVVQALKGTEGKLIDEIIKTEDAFVVAKVISKKEKGVMALDEVKDRLRPLVYNNKKAEIIRGKIGSATDLNAIAAASGSGATVQTAGNISFYVDPKQPLAGIQSENLVMGAAFSLAQGATSKPINGNGGVYVVRVDAQQVAPAMDEALVAMQRQFQTTAKRQANFQKYFSALIESADVQDYRYQKEL